MTSCSLEVAWFCRTAIYAISKAEGAAAQGCNCSLALPHARSELALPQSTPGIHTSHQQRARQATMWRRAVTALLLQYATALILTPAARNQLTRRHATETDVDFADAQWQLYAAQSEGGEGVWTTLDSQGIEQLAHTGCWDVSLTATTPSIKWRCPGPTAIPARFPSGRTHERQARAADPCGCGHGVRAYVTKERADVYRVAIEVRRVAVTRGRAAARGG